MASKFQQFLNDNKIDPRRLMVISRLVERTRPEDRAIRRTKKASAAAAAAAGAPAAGGEEKKPLPKPHSGRPITPRLLDQALNGKGVSGPAKTRLLRAVNRILEQKKKDPADLRALF
jgi:hypothetical protein